MDIKQKRTIEYSIVVARSKDEFKSAYDACLVFAKGRETITFMKYLRKFYTFYPNGRVEAQQLNNLKQLNESSDKDVVSV